MGKIVQLKLTMLIQIEEIELITASNMPGRQISQSGIEVLRTRSFVITTNLISKSSKKVLTD